MTPTPMAELRERFDATVTPWPGVARQAIFGHPGYGLRRKVFAFFDDGEVVVKASNDGREALLTHAGSYDWVPPGSGARRWGNWVGLPEAAFSDDEICDALEDAYRSLASSGAYVRA